jgi:hypothetical protein
MKQVALQLGCINYSVHPTILFASIKKQPYYLDVVNINQYDCILGTLFMYKHNIGLDFSTNTILIKQPKSPSNIRQGKNISSCQLSTLSNQKSAG